MSNYHEPFEHLPEEARAFHRAIRSLVEELEAVDWYHQRVTQTEDEELKAILAHNRDEEMEHAAMLLEWLRRNMPGWDGELRDYLFKDGPIVHHNIEEELSPASLSDLGIGALKPKGSPPEKGRE
ncbi:MAG: encapsulin-associated ferritin-like protein [Candidatus Neomarinimicrobiota bacterium]